MSEVKKGKAAHVYSVNYNALNKAIDDLMEHQEYLDAHIRGTLNFVKETLRRNESVRKARELNAK